MNHAHIITPEAVRAGRIARGLDQAAPMVSVHCADDIKVAAISWLWCDWLALGKLAILAGNPGSGKTTLALSLAATLTTAGRWPDRTPCYDHGSVLIWSGEDDPGDTLTPRLMAAGADLARVHFLNGVIDNGVERPFDPAHDTEHLRQTFAAIGDVRLLIIDPIVSAVAGDGHKSNDVRRGLQPLVDLAMAQRCAIIGITHFSKGSGDRNPLERVIGSQAYGALARVVMVAAKDEKDDSVRVLARAKSNLGPDDGGVSYTVESAHLDCGISTSRVVWTGKLLGNAREILGVAENGQDEGSSPVEAALRFLREALRFGAVATDTLKTDADGAGHAWSTVKRAKQRLDVVATKSGMGGGWFWSLPEATEEDQRARRGPH